MYEASFGLTEAPFSISPDPRYLYMSRRHQEAMAHLRYGIQESGGFVQLTGEVGTGKTTICRCMLEQLPENVDVALILNPQISHSELLAALCDEIGVSYPADASPKQLLDLLNARLIESFSQGRRTVLVIDEAQMLTHAVLEQIRMLTNLETTKQKLLQIILIGQPELSTTLSRSDLRQLAQRITARYHLEPLLKDETAEYIKYRLSVAGCHRPVFTRRATRRVYRLSRGVPRLINVICDRAMLGAYSKNNDTVAPATVSQAAKEVFGGKPSAFRRMWWRVSGLAVASALVVVVLRPQWYSFAVPGFEPVPAQSQSQVLDSGAGNDIAETRETASSSSNGALLEVSSEKQDGAVSFPELLYEGNLIESEQHALSRLLEAWRETPTDIEGLSCSTIEANHGLRCLQGSGGWEDLRTTNRVAALRLKNRDAYLMLTDLEPNHAMLAGYDGAYNFLLSEVEAYWDGEYLLLWRPPPYGAETISEHSEGVDVLWLRQTLSRVPSLRSVDIENTYFDESLKNHVMAFQRSNNLRVDGVAGVQTIIRLNSIVDPDVPKLEPTAG